MMFDISSPNPTILWKCFVQFKRIAFLSMQTLMIPCHGFQWSQLTLFNPSSSKSYKQNFSWKSTISSPRSTIVWKFPSKVKRLASVSIWDHTKKCNVTAINWANIQFLTSLLQKVSKEGFSRSSTISSTNSTILWRCLIQVNRFASVSTQNSTINCHRYHKSHNTLFNPYFSKS